MKDLIHETIASDRIAIWEEVARDGAQAETILTGPQRVDIARQMSAIFGASAPRHLIFAAGYPSLCKDEFEAIRQVVSEVDTCYLATHGRVTRGDVDLGIQALQGAKYGRVSFALPVSDRGCEVMMHMTKEEAINQAIEIAKYALDQSGGIPIDVAFGVATFVDPIFLAESAARLCEEGVCIVKICDSTGELFPQQAHHLFRGIMQNVPECVTIGSHVHNDFGLALANSLEAIRQGVRLVATSWLGLGERAGLPRTEEMLFALGLDPAGLPERLEITSPIWWEPPDLTKLVPIARHVSQTLDVPLRLHDPVVGLNMNHIATGAYFNNPKAFKPFDPHAVLGVPPLLLLTHLANHSIVETVASLLGYTLDKEQTHAALAWVKSYAFKVQKSVIPLDAFREYLASQVSNQTTSSS
ncbi:MAG: hypothetical protein JW726_03030 [Anaerolineales bacterium]|nr:hypothetical protein [Anaerolineales bacterium]